MGKNILKNIILILFLVLIIAFIMLNKQDLDFYENYNKAIPEPDSIKILNLK